MTLRILLLSLAMLPLAACHSAASDGGPDAVPTGRPFSQIGADETVRFVGTEPFWGGRVKGDRLIYETPTEPEGQTIAVTRFAGRNGLGYSGTLDGQPFDMTITPLSCSDGMSDRAFPFAVMLRIGEERRQGCAWSDRQPFRDMRQP